MTDASKNLNDKQTVAASRVVGADGDRRHATVLFVDLVNYTPLSERVGEEALYEIIRPIIELMTACVERHLGTVQDLTGDGIMAVFGAPVAQEDGPLQACRAALEILTEFQLLASKIADQYGAQPQARLGIHSGLIVLGRFNGHGQDTMRALGDTVNVAARFESAAPPNSILISDATYRLVEGFVDADSRGQLKLKGKSQPFICYQLKGLTKHSNRLDARLAREATPWIPRGPELARIEEAWTTVQGGKTQTILIKGDAGIGKSRLVSEFARLAREANDAVVLKGHCTADGSNTAYSPIIEAIRNAFRIPQSTDPKVVRHRLLDGLVVLGLGDSGYDVYLGNLLTGEQPDQRHSSPSEQIGNLTLLALRETLIARCRISPTILIIEDLHWIDRNTESLLDWLSEESDQFPVLILATTRPNYAGSCLQSEHVQHIELHPFPRREFDDLLRQRLSAAKISKDLSLRLFERSGGNPLFAEELANHMVTSGQIIVDDGNAVLDKESTETVVPQSLANILLEKIDRLEQDVRNVLSVAAVVGRRFHADVVEEVAGLNAHVSRCLDVLIDNEIVFRDSGSASAYHFKHALIHDVIYDRIFAKERVSLHRLVGRVMERSHKGAIAEIASSLAHHFGKSGEMAESIRYLYLAGQKSMTLYAIETARDQFVQALDLVDANPQAVSQSEVADLVIALMQMYLLHGDFKKIETRTKKYRQLIETLDDNSRLASYLCALAPCHVMNGQVDIANNLLDRGLKLAALTDNREALGNGLIAKSFLRLYWASPNGTDFDGINNDANAAFDIGKQLDHDVMTATAILVLGVCAMLQGDPRLVREHATMLLNIAPDGTSSISNQLGLYLLAWDSLMNNDADDALAKTEEALRMPLTPWVQTDANGLRGAALALSGQGREAYESLSKIREIYLARGNIPARVGLETNFGLSMFLSGNFGRGVKWIEQHEKLFLDLGFYQPLTGLYRITLGEIYLRIMQRSERLPLPVYLKNVLFFVRTVPVAKRKAQQCFEIAEKVSREHSVPALLAMALCGLAEVALANKDYERAQRHANEALSIADSIDAFACAERAAEVLSLCVTAG